MARPGGDQVAPLRPPAPLPAFGQLVAQHVRQRLAQPYQLAIDAAQADASLLAR